MIEWLPWLFLGAMAIFAMGWLVARVDIKELLRESRAMPQAYFKGLNFLLNEQQDKAIESFIEVTKANPEAVELQFALGSLFRRRGEVDRAIRVHQELSERSNLAPEQRTDALIELAMDFQKAGLLDHAERILVDLSAKPAGNRHQQLQTLRQLLDIHVQERGWVKAVDVAGRLINADDSTLASQPGTVNDSVIDKSTLRDRRAMANFHCELALDAYQQNRKPEAEGHLENAILANPKCVRAHLIRAEFCATEGRHRDVILSWRRIEPQDPAFLGLMANQIMASHEALGEGAEGLAELLALQRRYPAIDLLDTLFEATLKRDGAAAALAFIGEELGRNPTLAGLDKRYEAELLLATDDRKADLQVLKKLVHAHSTRLAVYLCAHCGFKAKQFHWQCPACGGWETFPPRLTSEYDTSERPPAGAKMAGDNSTNGSTN